MSPTPRPAAGVAAVILAAGESRRFGSPKQLAELHRRTLLEHVVDRAIGAGLDPVVAVVPAWFVPAKTSNEAILWVRNAHPERGMSESLQLGFAALPESAEAAVILLGDQPTLPATSIAAILAGRGERPIVAGRSQGHPTPPVLVERSHFGIVQEATGDGGLRGLLSARQELVTPVDMPPTDDVDTPEQLRALELRRDGR
jgi:molybdenum cofactor cytidylyltransferase